MSLRRCLPRPTRGLNSDVFHCTALCLLLAQSGHFAAEFQCPLSGVKQTSAKVGESPLLTQSGRDEAGRYAESWLHNAECSFAERSLSGKRRAPQRPAVASKTP